MMKKLLLAAALAAPLALAPVAQADPSQCFDPTLCGDPSNVYYCPDTGGYVTSFSGYCGSLVVGPYTPGGLRPGGGIGDVG